MDVWRLLEVRIARRMIFLCIGPEVELELRFLFAKRFLAREFSPEYVGLLQRWREVLIVTGWRFLCLLLCLFLLLFVEFSLQTEIVLLFLTFFFSLLTSLLFHLDPQLLHIVHLFVSLPLSLLRIDGEQSAPETVIRPNRDFYLRVQLRLPAVRRAMFINIKLYYHKATTESAPD